MRHALRGIAVAVAGFAFLAAPALAASGDYGVSGVTNNANNTFSMPDLLVSMGSSLTRVPAYGYSFGTNGSVTQLPSTIGTFSGISYQTTLNFNLSGFAANIKNNPSSAPTDYTLTLPYTSITGTPTISALAFVSSPGYSTIITPGGTDAQAFTLSATTTPGVAKLDFTPTFTRNLNTALASYGTGNFQVILSASSPAGAGVPAPVAGAGLPFAALAGMAWMLHRRRTARVA